MKNHNDNISSKSFVESFLSVSQNLSIRYSINMHLDFIQEFIKFVDNTRNAELQYAVLAKIQAAESDIINLIKNYEDERKDKENID